MKEKSEPLETLTEIRSMMERSTRFISLNGLAGVFAGIFALIGAYIAYRLMNNGIESDMFLYRIELSVNDNIQSPRYSLLFLDAILVLFASIAVAVFLSIRKARKKGLKIWDNSAKRLLINMLIPLVIGGIFCLILIYHGLIGLVAPATLLFYGAALINASKYTLNDIRYLGITQSVLGLMATFWTGYGLLFWAIGFGIVHIIYGTIMYYKYER